MKLLLVCMFFCHSIARSMEASSSADIESELTKLYDACVNLGNIDKSIDLEIDGFKNTRWSLLTLACYLGDENVTDILALLERGAGINRGIFFEGHHNITPLCLAFLSPYASSELVELLLDYGASIPNYYCSIHKENFHTVTALSILATDCALDKKELLVSYLKERYSKRQILEETVAHGRLSEEVIRFLLVRTVFDYEDIQQVVADNNNKHWLFHTPVRKQISENFEAYIHRHNLLEERLPGDGDLSSLTLEYVGDDMFAETEILEDVFCTKS